MTFKEELINILEEELQILQVLKEITFDKTDIIIGNEVEKLEGLTKREEKTINRLGLIEEERLYLMDNWGVGINTPLSQVIERIEEGKDELLEMQEKLRNYLEEIKMRNHINNELIHDNLQWLELNMNLISNAQTPPTYGKDSGGKGVNNSLFDRKV